MFVRFVFFFKLHMNLFLSIRSDLCFSESLLPIRKFIGTVVVESESRIEG